MHHVSLRNLLKFNSLETRKKIFGETIQLSDNDCIMAEQKPTSLITLNYQ